jgi:hypothetical protein
MKKTLQKCIFSLNVVAGLLRAHAHPMTSLDYTSAGKYGGGCAGVVGAKWYTCMDRWDDTGPGIFRSVYGGNRTWSPVSCGALDGLSECAAGAAAFRTCGVCELDGLALVLSLGTDSNVAFSVVTYFSKSGGVLE